MLIEITTLTGTLIVTFFIAYNNTLYSDDEYFDVKHYLYDSNRYNVNNTKGQILWINE